MEVSDSKTERYFINTVLEISIKDYSTATKQVSKSVDLRNSHNDFEISFFASVLPNRDFKSLKDCLVVFVNETVHEGFIIPNNSRLSWIVSIIDREGNSRLPRTFRKNHFQKYLRTSFILSKADEFLTDDVLTLRFDVYFSCYGLTISFDPLLSNHSMQRGSKVALNDFYRSIPQSVCFKIDYPTDSFLVYDFTTQILTLPQFHEKRKRFGVHGVPPCDFPWIKSKSKEDNTCNFEHIWIFDTYPDKFILSLDERQDNVGALLLKNSSFIRRCVNVPMKEQREKRIDFSNVNSHTFKILLFFLEIGTLSCSRNREALDVYTFSHMYQLDKLQQKCTDQMLRNFALADFKNLQNIAKYYSDEYFLTQLFSKLDGYQNENLIQKGFEIDHRLDYDCYI